MALDKIEDIRFGLSSAEARKRLRRYGHNHVHRQQTSVFALIIKQFAGPLSWLLIGAAAVSYALGQGDDAIMIVVLLTLNTLLSLVLELRAERALSALHARTAERALVRRDGAQLEISSLDVVPGDMLVLEAGGRVTADARLHKAYQLQLQEHELTGESRPVCKQVGAVDRSKPLRERLDCVFSGTQVDSGSGLAEVFATGKDTEIARLEASASANPAISMLEQQLVEVTRALMWVCASIVALVALSDLVRGRSWSEVFLTGVALAVAALPEGLPMIVTLGLVRGMRHMASRQILVRRLDAIESVGSTTVVCSGKSGVLTTGTAEVRALWGTQSSKRLLQAAARGLNNDADASRAARQAILQAAKGRWNDVEPPAELDAAEYRTASFDALELLGLPIDAEARRAARSMREQGHTQLAVAMWRQHPAGDGRLLGIVGISEPPRPGAREALARVRDAGIRIVVVTGDDAEPAVALAREVGLLQGNEATDGVVHPRATPESKLELVRTLQKHGEVVAMTGESANNVPALREADIAFCVAGSSEVTRAASDMIMLDDDFAHVVSAIKFGRGIYANIQRSLVYLMAGNVAELAVMLIASTFGLPVPLTPVQLLWVNMVTDGPPALALLFAPIDDDVMQRPPRGRRAHLLGLRQWQVIAAVGALQTTLCLGIFAWGLHAFGLQSARNLLFTLFVCVEVTWALAAQDARKSLWERGLRANLAVMGVALPSLALQLLLPYLPFGHVLLGERAAGFEVGLPLLLACGLTLVIELAKFARSRRTLCVRAAAPHEDLSRSFCDP